LASRNRLAVLSMADDVALPLLARLARVIVIAVAVP
jgi:hypothetical protein